MNIGKKIQNKHAGQNSWLVIVEKTTIPRQQTKVEPGRAERAKQFAYAYC